MIQTNMIGIPVQVRQAFVGVQTTGFSAGGTTQANSPLIPSDFLQLSTVASGAGLLLPGGVDTPSTPGPATLGDTINIVNYGANPCLLWPQVGGKLSNGTLNASASLAANKITTAYYLGSGNWVVELSA